MSDVGAQIAEAGAPETINGRRNLPKSDGARLACGMTRTSAGVPCQVHSLRPGCRQLSLRRSRMAWLRTDMVRLGSRHRRQRDVRHRRGGTLNHQSWRIHYADTDQWCLLTVARLREKKVKESPGPRRRCYRRRKASGRRRDDGGSLAGSTTSRHNSAHEAEPDVIRVVSAVAWKCFRVAGVDVNIVRRRG